MSCFTIWTVQSTVTCESGWAPSRKSVYFGIHKLIFYFPYFMYHVLHFSLCFHIVISVFCTSIYAVFVIDRTRKQTLLIKWFNIVFTKDLPSISLSNIQAVKAEKEERYTLSNMIYICNFTKDMLLYKYFSIFFLRFVFEHLFLRKPFSSGC